MIGIETWASEVANDIRGKNGFRFLVEEYWREVVKQLESGIAAFNSVLGSSPNFKITMEPDELLADVWELSYSDSIVVVQLPVNENAIQFGEISEAGPTTSGDLKHSLPIRTAQGTVVAAYDGAGECTPEDVARKIMKTLLQI